MNQREEPLLLNKRLLFVKGPNARWVTIALACNHHVFRMHAVNIIAYSVRALIKRSLSA